MSCTGSNTRNEYDFVIIVTIVVNVGVVIIVIVATSTARCIVVWRHCPLINVTPLWFTAVFVAGPSRGGQFRPRTAKTRNTPRPPPHPVPAPRTAKTGYYCRRRNWPTERTKSLLPRRTRTLRLVARQNAVRLTDVGKHLVPAKWVFTRGSWPERS